MSNKSCDLYLYKFNDSKFLIKIPKVTFDIGTQYAQKWLAIDAMHDYMLVTEGSTPWHVEPENIDIRDLDWLDKKYNTFMKG